MFKRGKRKSKIKTKDILSCVTKGDPAKTWSIEGQIGEGATSTVHRVVRKEGGQVAAGKAIKCPSSADLEEFGVEVLLLSKQKHDSLIALVEGFWHKKTLWLMVELATGGAFDDILEAGGCKGLSEPQLRSVAAQVTPGLAFLHSQGVWHRDIKAGNLLLTGDGRVKITDFSSCSLNNGDGKKRDTFLGSPFWMPPEVIACDMPKSKAKYDHKVDSWSLGVTLIELGDGEVPWLHLSPYRAMLKIVKEPSPSFADPHSWSDAAYDFIESACHKDPDDRQGCEELAHMPFASGPADLDVLMPLAGLSHAGGAAGGAMDADEAFDGFASGAPSPDGEPEPGGFGFT